MKRTLVHIFLFLFIIFNDFLAQPALEQNTTDTKQLEVWRGNVVGVYQNKGTIKVLLNRQPKWYGLSKEALKARLLQSEVYTLYQKGTNRVIGKFQLRDIFVHSGRAEKVSRERIYVTLTGKIYASLDRKYIQTDLYIAGFKKVVSYIDPSGFYRENLTGPNKSIIHAVDKKEMVLVTQGNFLYGQGSNERKDNYNPFYDSPDTTNLMSLPSFYIDKYEVTNREYYNYLRSTHATPPSHWKNGMYPRGKANHPVILLAYREVQGYANWTGKRIPSEFEWEKAARGQGLQQIQLRDETFRFIPQTRKYPFGNRFDTIFCNTRESKIMDTVSVYDLSQKGSSVYGAIGMCGNAPEWTSSWYRSYSGNGMLSRDYGKQYKVIRGGSYTSSKQEATTFFRDYGGIPNLREDRKAGFRLVKDLAE
ncbi:MAG: SUMF1/EgtB/PvdO family nonheme iron enzyme [Spirochaetota bacterium]